MLRAKLPVFAERYRGGGDMNIAEFAVIAKLIRSREPVKTAAMMVLVEGVSGIEAAANAGVSPASVSNTVTRFRHADAEIRRAYKVENNSKIT